MGKKMFRKMLCVMLTLMLTIPLLVQDVDAASVTIKSAKATAMTLKKSKTTISFKVNKKMATKVKILNSSNKVVKTLSAKTAKKNKVIKFTWNGKDAKGKYVKAGTYKAKIYAGKKTKTVKFKVKKAAAATPTPTPKPTATPTPKPTPKPEASTKNELTGIQDNLVKQILSTRMPIPCITGGHVAATVKCGVTGDITLQYGMKQYGSTKTIKQFKFAGTKGKTYKVNFPLSGGTGPTMYTNLDFYVSLGDTQKTLPDMYYMSLYYLTPTATVQ